jgi:hypothetical protein
MDERREEALRPSRFLGFDRDALGMYLVSVESYKIAASQFRRAVWLNPFEPRFRVHLAWCLSRQRRFTEALQTLNPLAVSDLPEDLQTTVALIFEASSRQPPTGENEG